MTPARGHLKANLPASDDGDAGATDDSVIGSALRSRTNNGGLFSDRAEGRWIETNETRLRVGKTDGKLHSQE